MELNSSFAILLRGSFCWRAASSADSNGGIIQRFMRLVKEGYDSVVV